MARGKEISVVLFDVGSTMEACIEYAGKAVSNFLLSKMINKPLHEVSLVFFGTKGTDNLLSREFADDGDASQYLHITVAEPLSPVTLTHLAHLQKRKTEEGASDFIDALTVAVDVLYRALTDRPELEKATVGKRITLVTNFLSQVGEDTGGEFTAVLNERLKAKNIQLEVISIDFSDQDKDHLEAKAANRDVLGGLLWQGVQVKYVRDIVELVSAFKVKEYSHTAYYAGPLTIGDLMTIDIKVTKKTSHERLPTMEKFSDRSSAEDATHQVLVERLIKRGEVEVPSEERGRGYKYGGQIVPLVSEVERLLKYAPEKCFEVVGVVDQDAVPRHMFVWETYCVAPDKGDPKSYVALSALAKSLADNSTALIARFVPRLNGEITVGLLTPFPEQEGMPQVLAMNCLPFEMDIRQATFAPFSKKPKLLPDTEQTAAMDALIDNLTIGDGDDEWVVPESTGNPTLHRFLEILGILGRQSGSDVPRAEDDVLAQQTLGGNLKGRPGLDHVLRKLQEKFKFGDKP